MTASLRPLAACVDNKRIICHTSEGWENFLNWKLLISNWVRPENFHWTD
jgi:hypothetical protein